MPVQRPHTRRASPAVETLDDLRPRAMAAVNRAGPARHRQAEHRPVAIPASSLILLGVLWIGQRSLLACARYLRDQRVRGEDGEFTLVSFERYVPSLTLDPDWLLTSIVSVLIVL